MTLAINFDQGKPPIRQLHYDVPESLVNELLNKYKDRTRDEMARLIKAAGYPLFVAKKKGMKETFYSRIAHFNWLYYGKPIEVPKKQVVKIYFENSCSYWLGIYF